MSCSNLPISTGTLRTIQNVSGVAFSSFMFLHLPTTISASMGPFGYNEALKIFRKFYQCGVIEVGLAASLTAHIAAGVILQRRRPETKVALPWYVNLQRVTGVVLSILVPIHAFATRGLKLLGMQRASEYDHIRSTMVGKPSFVFIPYYAVLLASGIYHTIFGLSQILDRTGYMPFTTHRTLSERGWLVGITSLITAAGFVGIFAFSTKEGIPESYKYAWQRAIGRNHQV